jgi:HSP20 family protein
MLGLVPYRKTGLPDVFREMEELTKGFWPEFTSRDLTTGEGMEWAPMLDLTETEGNLEIKAELPGMERKDIDITLDRGLLVIKGEKKEEKEEKGRYYHRVERRYGTFCRSVRLPAEVKEEKIEATFKDGVLTVTLPKVESEIKKVTHIDVH